MSDRIPLILDLDTGIDDALALAYVLGSPEVELVGVVTTYGNVTVQTAARNTRALLDLLGHPEIPVWLGADRALAASGSFSVPPAVVRIHGENGLGGAALPGGVAQGPALWPALSLAEALAERPDLRYVPTGPLTNLARALSDAPELAERLPRVTFMGGALTVPGNVTPRAEANIHNDPEAADAVLRSGLRTRMVGLDVTHQVVLTREATAAWRALGTPVARFYADMTDHYISIYEKNNPQLGGCALHDPLAVAVAIDPSLVTCVNLDVLVDQSGAMRENGAGGCAFAREVDASRFLEEFRTRVRRVLM